VQTTIQELRLMVREILIEEELNEDFKSFAKKHKNMFVLPTIIFSLSTVGCRDKLEDTKFNAKGFTETEIAAIQDAADEWCEATNGKECAVIGDEGDSRLEIKDVVVCGDNPDALGCNKPGLSKTVEIDIKNLRSDPDWLMKLHDFVRHELGHKFDHCHLPGGNVMAPSYENDIGPKSLSNLDIKTHHGDRDCIN
jgi:hypothetical protein